MTRKTWRDALLLLAAFAAGYSILFEGVPDDWYLGGLPVRVEAVLIAVAVALGRWAMTGILVGAAILRVLGIDGLPWTFAVAETVTFGVALMAARRVWLRTALGWNALGATAVLTAIIVAGLGTYWTIPMGPSAYRALFLQSFLAINVFGAISLLGISLWELRERARPAVVVP